VTVRLTEFWDRMRAQLADGEDAKLVWRAVCESFNVSDSQR
jgi:hypothetical protein